jgi:hypothetical protein
VLEKLKTVRENSTKASDVIDPTKGTDENQRDVIAPRPPQSGNTYNDAINVDKGEDVASSADKKKTTKNQKWTDEETDLLLSLEGPLTSAVVAQFFPGRTLQQCRSRLYYVKNRGK